MTVQDQGGGVLDRLARIEEGQAATNETLTEVRESMASVVTEVKGCNLRLDRLNGTVAEHTRSIGDLRVADAEIKAMIAGRDHVSGRVERRDQVRSQVTVSIISLIIGAAVGIAGTAAAVATALAK